MVSASHLKIGHPQMEYWGHDDFIKWKHFPRYWTFVRGIHRWPVNSLHKGQWHGALFYLIFTWINSWVNNREAGDLRRHRAHYDVIVVVPDGILGYPILKKLPWLDFKIRAVKLPWIFPGAQLTFNGAPGNIQGNLDKYVRWGARMVVPAEKWTIHLCCLCFLMLIHHIMPSL